MKPPEFLSPKPYGKAPRAPPLPAPDSLTAKFGATGEPLADGAPSGPGSERSHERK
jgi:hypothetical protein